MAWEIKRKFLLHRLPTDREIPRGDYIRKGYILRRGAEEVRIRRMGRKHFLTIKSKGNPLGNRFETRLKKGQFEALWPSTRGNRLEKRRVTLFQGDVELRLDIFGGLLEGLITAEAVFPSPAEAGRFIRPSYFGVELTFDSRFKDSSLAEMSREEFQRILTQLTREEYPLIGALPYMEKKGRYHLVMVTTRTHGHWIFPKGQPMTGREAREVALIEALEEAGIRGEASENPLIIPYEKNGQTQTLALYPLEATKISKEWDESCARKRKLLTPEEARRITHQKGMKAAVGYLDFLANRTDR